MGSKIIFIIATAYFAVVSAGQLFYGQQVVATIEDERLLEASGIEQSYTNPGYFWTHNDSGGEPTLYLIDGRGKIAMEVELLRVKNRDWEEIVTVKEGDKSYIYVAEMGDNNAVHRNVSLIRLKEPKLTDAPKQEIVFESLEIMKFTYSEGARDAEALLYDQQFKEFVLVTKREKQALIYSFDFVPNQTIRITSKGTIPSRLFTAADMNEDGEILLKNYDSIFYWGKSKTRALDRILEWKGQTVNYVPEPQGEAICWYQNSFYTISEKNVGKPQQMLYFKRKN